MNAGLTALEMAGLILSGEFALVAFVVPALLLRHQRRQVSADTVATETLLGAVEAKAPSRREALATIFSTTYQLQGEELDARIDEFVAREQAFYQVMTRVYLERDGDSLQALPEELTKVISPWLRLTPRNMVDSASLSTLATTNAELSAELDETKRSMADLMHEYMRAFDKGRALEEATAAEAVPLAPASAIAGVPASKPEIRREPAPAETLQMAADDGGQTNGAMAARQSLPVTIDDLAIDDAPAGSGAISADDIDDLVAVAHSPAHSPLLAPAQAIANDIDDDLARAQAPVAVDDIDDILAQAKVTPAVAITELDYIDVSEDSDEVAFSQDDLDALTDLFESEIEDSPVAASA